MMYCCNYFWGDTTAAVFSSCKFHSFIFYSTFNKPIIVKYNVKKNCLLNGMGYLFLHTHSANAPTERLSHTIPCQ